ncbi:hypothetical protein LINPERPRIM_LOCUS39596 [Linum perenne]
MKITRRMILKLLVVVAGMVMIIGQQHVVLGDLKKCFNDCINTCRPSVPACEQQCFDECGPRPHSVAAHDTNGYTFMLCVTLTLNHFILFFC